MLNEDVVLVLVRHLPSYAWGMHVTHACRMGSNLYGDYNTRRYTLVQSFHFFKLFLVGPKELNTSDILQ